MFKGPEGDCGWSVVGGREKDRLWGIKGRMQVLYDDYESSAYRWSLSHGTGWSYLGSEYKEQKEVFKDNL